MIVVASQQKSPRSFPADNRFPTTFPCFYFFFHRAAPAKPVNAPRPPGTGFLVTPKPAPKPVVVAPKPAPKPVFVAPKPAPKPAPVARRPSADSDSDDEDEKPKGGFFGLFGGAKK